MKRIFVALCAALLLLTLTGCKLYGNDRSNVGLLHVNERDASVELSLPDGVLLTYGRADGALTLSREEKVTALPAVTGSTFPQDAVNYAKGAEGLQEKIEALSADKGRGLYTVFGYEEKGQIVGFVDFYASAVGFLSGGGQIDVDKFDCAVLFSYQMETGGFEQTDFDRLVVAYDGEYAVCYEDARYVSVEIATGNSVPICEDVALDTGFSHSSYANFSFGGGYIVLRFRNGNGSGSFRKNYELYVLARMNGETLSTLREEE